MTDYANKREFLRSVPRSLAAQARFIRFSNYAIAAICGAGLGVCLALSI